ncbi:response regulator [Actinomadura nitritigenes]|uniref:response regulator n=1 Tax=Actinomadura nitritigenes TaxID=134602 RepID=UPI003D90388F
MRVLVVEDEIRTAALLQRGLREEGYAVDVAVDGPDAVWQAVESPYDAIVLDVMLPGLDGFEVCRRLRVRGCWAPVLMLTARDAVSDRVQGLDAGADDYLTKPFSFAELLARLRALARRGAKERPTLPAVGDLRLDPSSRRVWRGEIERPLSPKEGRRGGARRQGVRPLAVGLPAVDRGDQRLAATRIHRPDPRRFHRFSGRVRRWRRHRPAHPRAQPRPHQRATEHSNVV